MSKYPVKVKLVTKPLSVLEVISAARSDVLSLLPKIATRQPIIEGRTIASWVMLMDPKALRKVLVEKLDDYPKSDVTKSVIREASGNSIFVIEGDVWKWQRRAASQVFSLRNVNNLTPLFTDAAQRCVDRVKKAQNEPIDMGAEMVQTTFEIIADVSFSDENGFDRAAVYKAINDFMEHAGKLSIFDLFNLPEWVPRPNRLISGSAMRNIRALAKDVIEAREQSGASTPPDLLDLLMEGEDPETKRKMNHTEIRDNLLTFITAGHETTAIALSWALYLLAFDQDVQRKVQEEVRRVVGTDPVTKDHISDLKYTRQVVDETLRLYPPAPIVSRTALKPDVLCGRKIPKGRTILIPIYCLHRNELYWEDPDKFDPDRFDGSKPIDRFTYLPFIDGPRICIGASFAIQEAVVILATLANNFHFTAVDGKEPRPKMVLTMRPEGGVWLNVTPRE